MLPCLLYTSYMGQIAYQNSGTQVRLLGFGGKERTYMAWDYASKEDMEKYGRRYNPCGEYIDDQGNRAYYPDQYDNFVQHHLQLLIYQRLAERWHLNVAGHYTRGDGYYNQLKTNRKLVEYGLAPFTSPDGELVKRSDLCLLYTSSHHGILCVEVELAEFLAVEMVGAVETLHLAGKLGFEQ